MKKMNKVAKMIIVVMVAILFMGLFVSLFSGSSGTIVPEVPDVNKITLSDNQIIL